MARELNIGIIGLGAMGLGMAVCLSKAGFQVCGFDINSQAVSRLVGEGGKAADSPQAAAEDIDLLMLVVATSDQASSVVFDDDSKTLASLKRNSVILLCITAAPRYPAEFRSRLDAAGRSDVKLVDCPISGGEVRAWHGSLSLLCAGNQADIDEIRNALDCMSSQLHIIPGGIGTASSVKMIHQILVGVHIAAAVEVMGLAYVAGLDLQTTYDAVMKSDGASWLFGQRAAHMLDEDKVPASSLMIITKDFAMLTASGREDEVSLDLASIVYQLFIQTSSAGWSTTDDCHVINMYLLGRGKLQDLRLGSKRLAVKSGIDASTITNILKGIHATAAVEVLKYAKKLGVDDVKLKTFVKTAAGSSGMFDKVCEQLHLQSEISVNRIEDSESLRQELVTGINAAQTFGYPLFLASTALQQFYGS